MTTKEILKEYSDRLCRSIEISITHLKSFDKKDEEVARDFGRKLIKAVKEETNKMN